MAKFCRSSYTFDRSNVNYINAIQKYNKNVFIEKLNGRDVSNQSYSGSDLMAVVNKTRADEFNIEVVSSNSSSTVGVFPAIDTENLITAVSDVLSENDLKIVDENVAKIEEYFKRLTAKGGFDVYIGPPDDLATMTQSQAILILDKLQKKFTITGAMLLTDHDSILLQFRGDNFILQYGAKTCFDQMTQMALDIDDGFCADSNFDRIIQGKLQTFFTIWKNNNYVGDLIPTSGFKYGQTAKLHTIKVDASPQVVNIPAAVGKTHAITADQLRDYFAKQEKEVEQLQSLNQADLLAGFGLLASNASAVSPVNEEKNQPGPKF